MPAHSAPFYKDVRKGLDRCFGHLAPCTWDDGREHSGQNVINVRDYVKNKQVKQMDKKPGLAPRLLPRFLSLRPL